MRIPDLQSSNQFHLIISLQPCLLNPGKGLYPRQQCQFSASRYGKHICSVQLLLSPCSFTANFGENHLPFLKQVFLELLCVNFRSLINLENHFGEVCHLCCCSMLSDKTGSPRGLLQIQTSNLLVQICSIFCYQPKHISHIKPFTYAYISELRAVTKYRRNITINSSKGSDFVSQRSFLLIMEALNFLADDSWQTAAEQNFARKCKDKPCSFKQEHSYCRCWQQEP